jgi:hypothetical protein
MLVSSELDALASVHAEAITILVGFALILLTTSDSFCHAGFFSWGAWE